MILLVAAIPIVLIPILVTQSANDPDDIAPPMGSEFHVPATHTEDDLYTQRVCPTLTSLPPRATNERIVSNEVFSQSAPIPDERGLNSLIWGWGQFIDHDIVLSQTDTDAPPTTLQMVPYERNITLVRVIKRENNETLNTITGAIDASTVYGDYKNPDKITGLRIVGNCRMVMGPNGTPKYDGTTFECGDERCAEHALLSSLHALLLREHNRWCDELDRTTIGWTQEQKFWQARALTIAVIQKITYDEWLPALFGTQAYRLYQQNTAKGTSTRIATEFAASAYRFGHSMVANTLGELPLVSLFFNASKTIHLGLDSIFERALHQHAEKADSKAVDGLRNILFGMEDLVTRNLYRAREIGLPTYQDMCQCYGTTPISTSYVDPIVGLLLEPHPQGSSIGTTVAVILAEQFNRLRRNDPDFYFDQPHLFSINQRTIIYGTTLKKLIERNTHLRNIKQNAFYL